MRPSGRCRGPSRGRGTSIRAGAANTLQGDGTLSADTPRADEPADTYVYDPEFPVQTQGGCNCCQPDIIPWGPYDQRDVEMRSDVLVYTSRAAGARPDGHRAGPGRALGGDRRARHRLDGEAR